MINLLIVAGNVEMWCGVMGRGEENKIVALFFSMKRL
jgi:hypothetical protein